MSHSASSAGKSPITRRVSHPLSKRWRGLRRVLDATYLRDALIASDPGLVRLTMALRATVTGVVTAVVLELLLQLVHQPGTLLIVGVGIGTMSTLWINDQAPRAQAITTAILPLPCITGLVLGGLCATSAWLGTLGFVAVTFVAVYARRYGPRGNALGMGVFLSFVYALFLGVSTRTLPWMVACMLIAIICNFGARFLVLREHPERTLKRLRGAFDACVRGLLLRYAAALQNDDWESERPAVLVGLTNLNGIALALEDALARSAAKSSSDGGARWFVVELALQRMAASARHALGAGTERAVLAEVGECLMRMRAAVGAPQALLAIDDELRQLGAASRLVTDARELGKRLAGVCSDVKEMHAWQARPSASSGAVDAQRILRQALQAALAAGLASAVGRLLSYTRWYWAVLASFVIFSRASSRGDTLIRGAHRVVGTVLGLGAGLGLVHVAHARPTLALPLLFAMLFFGIYFLRASYTVMVACITCALALLYGVLGRPTGELLHVRLEETAVGVAVGTLVAMCVLPIRTRPLVFTRMSEVLRSVREALQQVASWLEGASWQDGPVAAARAVDRARQRLREAAAPFAGRIGALAFPGLTHEMLVVSALVYEMRELLHGCAVSAPALEPEARRRLANQLCACAQALLQLQAQLEPGARPQPAAAEQPRLDITTDSAGLFARVSRLGDAMRDLQESLAQ